MERDAGKTAKPNFGPILQRIVETKRVEVARLHAATTLEDLRARAADAPPPRGFRDALIRPGAVRLIAEVKKASPSKGLIREDFDPARIARAYAEGGAAAISVLTDAMFFQGSLGAFRQVRRAVDLPMLRKEFIVDPWQVVESRAAGADAILLITSILEDSLLVELHGLALDFGMDVLVETHAEYDVRRALRCIEPSLLGVNNRDLHDPQFHTDLGHTGRMIPVVQEVVGDVRPVPPVVSESGIYEPEDVARLRALGVSAVLVGESLMRQADPGAAARALMAQAGG